MRILLTNNTMDFTAGSELFVRDLALSLMRRGHAPVVYSQRLGPVAESLRMASVPVVADLADLTEPPDLIHGQHHLEAVSAILRFPMTPAVLVCHGWLPGEERPVVFPSIRRYVAVDDLCRERVLTTPGVDPDLVRTIYNAVDLDRFRPRSPLPDRPQRALVFSNLATRSGYVEEVRKGCQAVGIDSVEIWGSSSGNVRHQPEDELGQFDVVFAKARSAMEAMAVGCAVVVADVRGLAGLVEPANVEELRRYNFGLRTLQRRGVTADAVAEELARYSPTAAADVRDHLRTVAGLESSVDLWETLYAEVMAEWSDRAESDASLALEQLSAASTYLPTLAELVKSREKVDQEVAIARDQKRQADLATGEAQRSLAEVDAAARQTDQALAKAVAEARRLRRQRDRAERRRQRAVAKAERLQGQLDRITRSRAWRSVQGYRKVRRSLWKGKPQ